MMYLRACDFLHFSASTIEKDLHNYQENPALKKKKEKLNHRKQTETTDLHFSSKREVSKKPSTFHTTDAVIGLIIETYGNLETCGHNDVRMITYSNHPKNIVPCNVICIVLLRTKCSVSAKTKSCSESNLSLFHLPTHLCNKTVNNRNAN